MPSGKRPYMNEERMHQDLLNSILSQTPEIVRAFAENPMAASQFITLAAIVALVVVSVWGRK